MKQQYLPAILPTTLSNRWGLSPMNFLDCPEDSPGYFPHALISYYHWRSSRRELDRNKIQIFGDSGGYSIATLGAEETRIDPTSVIYWQIKYCSVGVILDVPPFINVGSSVLSGSAVSNWEKALDTTVENTRRALPIYLRARREGTPFRWWGVVHGETAEQRDEWYSRVADIYPFDDEGEGWGVKVHPANSTTHLAALLRWCKRRGITRTHWLQMTGVPAVMTLFLLGPIAGLKYASYDSAASSFAGINRAVYKMNPDGISFTSVVEKTKLGETQGQEILLDCPCQSCEWLREDLPQRKKLLKAERDWKRKLKKPGEPELMEYWKYRMIFHNTLIAARIYENLDKRCAEEGFALAKEFLGYARFAKTMRAFRGYQEGMQEAQVLKGSPVSILDLL